jgi:cell division protein FtsZ
MRLDIVRLGDVAGGRPRAAIVGCGGAGCNSLRFADPGLGMTAFALNHSFERVKTKAAHRLEVPEGDLAAAVSTDPRIDLSGHVHTASVLAQHFKQYGMVFSIVGLGGTTGWGCATLAARVARECSALSVCVAILPFSVESRERVGRAKEQRGALRDACDGLIAIHNDRMSQVAPKVPFSRAMEVVSELALLAPQELSNACGAGDVGPLRKVFRASNLMQADVATAKGDERGFKVARDLMASKWLSIDAREVVSAVLLVSGERDEEELVGAARELRNSAPNLKALAFGRSSSVPRDPHALRACAVLGTR